MITVWVGQGSQLCGRGHAFACRKSFPVKGSYSEGDWNAFAQDSEGLLPVLITLDREVV